ncbi:MAG: protein kinase [Deltaproteobacteria bacterium]|nr:protein kinase [Deltaproteobacteria bacterium]
MALPCPRCEFPNADQARYCAGCGERMDFGGTLDPRSRGSDLPPDPRVGTMLLDRYKVLKVVGEGGMGRVYLAEQRMGAVNRRVAIKTMHVDLRAEALAAQRFQRECETVVQLSHPNTIQFYDFGELPDGALYIVMEFVEGVSLGEVLEEGPLGVQRVDRLLVQICGSLAEAHQRGIIHRDLKPGNIHITERGGQKDFVKVLDFGIAKKLDAPPTGGPVTMQGTVLGTPPYMAPEQFSSGTLDARADQYALAVLTYEMLCGALPFEGRTPWEWATLHLQAQPRPFESHAATRELPGFRRAAVLKALAKRREDRFADVLEFLQAFTGIRDVQSAWTLVTSGSHLVAQRDSPSPVVPATPSPEPAPGPFPAASTPHPSQGPWNAGPGSSGGFSSGVPPAPIVPSVVPPGPPGPVWNAAPEPSGERFPTGAVVLFGVLALLAFSILAVGVAVLIVRRDDAPSNDTVSPWGQRPQGVGVTDTDRAAGPRDNVFAVVPPGSALTLEAPSGWRFVGDGHAGGDIEVWADPARPGLYWVEVQDTDGRWVLAAEHIRGPVAVDLDRLHVRGAVRVRVQNRSMAPVAIDAIKGLRVVR